MPTVNVVDQQKQVVGELELPEQVFAVQIKPQILHLVIKSQLAAKRAGTVGVKTRSNIRGGGRKPWRQKGTGRARAGSTRSPLWTGGAITHGPVSRDYSIKVNRKVKRLALRMALSSKLAEGKLVLLDKLEISRPKTKDFVQVQNLLDLKKALIVLAKKDNNLELAVRNIPGIKLIYQEQLGVYDILSHDTLVLTPAVVEHIQERLQ
ncbi:MAG: 50S ribosomal protein L4 [Thermodesulfobacteriota bacterium]